MEEKIVILGNGFDLRHFLPTSYNHLISILSEIEKLSDNKSTITFSDLFDGVFKEKNEWFYQKINEYYQTENFIFDVESIKSIHTRLKNNSWFQYFKSVDENKIEKLCSNDKSNNCMIMQEQLFGLVSNYNGLVADYNSASSKFNWSLFNTENIPTNYKTK